MEFKNLLESATKDMIEFLSNTNVFKNIEILNILRGGLNFPLEESCLESDISIKSISFLSSERVFDKYNISNIETYYTKISPTDEGVVFIGDIIASGSTIENAIKYICKAYIEAKKQLKNIFIFTIGTLKTIDLISKINSELKNIWPDFEGIIVSFYEGIFSVYENNGITKLNIPHVDFFINGAFITPEFRDEMLNSKSYIYERCTIYDGGERRFSPDKHAQSIIEYWNDIKSIELLCYQKLIKEKFGYGKDCELSEWLKIVGYNDLSNQKYICELYNKEMKFISCSNYKSFSSFCAERCNFLARYYGRLVEINA